MQNYPNPFNPATLIHYILAAPGAVELAIYNVLGHKVRTLVDTYQEAGRYSVEWDGMAAMAAGVYIYRLRAGAGAASAKMTLMDGAAKAPATAPPSGLPGRHYPPLMQRSATESQSEAPSNLSRFWLTVAFSLILRRGYSMDGRSSLG